jgi:hypothetical protein
MGDLFKNNVTEVGFGRAQAARDILTEIEALPTPADKRRYIAALHPDVRKALLNAGRTAGAFETTRFQPAAKPRFL